MQPGDKILVELAASGAIESCKREWAAHFRERPDYAVRFAEIMTGPVDEYIYRLHKESGLAGLTQQMLLIFFADLLTEKLKKSAEEN